MASRRPQRLLHSNPVGAWAPAGFGFFCRRRSFASSRADAGRWQCHKLVTRSRRPPDRLPPLCFSATYRADVPAAKKPVFSSAVFDSRVLYGLEGGFDGRRRRPFGHAARVRRTRTRTIRRTTGPVVARGRVAGSGCAKSAFVDSHAEQQKIHIEGTEDHQGFAEHYRNEQLESYPRSPFGGDGRFDEYRCIIVRGPGWQKDTMPADLVSTGLSWGGGGRPSYENCVQ